MFQFCKLIAQCPVKTRVSGVSKWHKEMETRMFFTLVSIFEAHFTFNYKNTGLKLVTPKNESLNSKTLELVA